MWNNSVATRRISQFLQFGIRGYLILINLGLFLVILIGCASNVPQLKYGTLTPPNTAYFPCNVNDFSTAISDVESGMNVARNDITNDTCNFDLMVQEYFGNLTPVGQFSPKTYENLYEVTLLTGMAVPSDSGCIVSCLKVRKDFYPTVKGHQPWEGNYGGKSFEYFMGKIDRSLMEPSPTIKLPKLHHGVFLTPYKSILQCSVDRLLNSINNVKPHMNIIDDDALEEARIIVIEYEKKDLRKSIAVNVVPSDSGCIVSSGIAKIHITNMPYGFPKDLILGNSERADEFINMIKKIDSEIKR